MAQFTRILSLDGGGLRGIISAEVLKYVEQKLQDFTGNSDARIADYFDLIAGTSAGGILTALYLCPDPENPLRPRCSAQEVYDFFDINLVKYLIPLLPIPCNPWENYLMKNTPIKSLIRSLVIFLNILN
jgi:Patatin